MDKRIERIANGRLHEPEEHYITEDLILSELDLPKPVEIRIDITEDRVQLIIGPRDFGWKRHHPDLTDAGTTFDTPIPFNPDDLPDNYDSQPVAAPYSTNTDYLVANGGCAGKPVADPVAPLKAMLREEFKKDWHTTMRLEQVFAAYEKGKRNASDSM